MSTALDIARERLREKSDATRIAVVGASNDPEKYGNIIVRTLAGHGYTVLPINPKAPAIAGLPAYPDLASAPGPVHIVDMVTPPDVTRQVLQNLDAAAVDVVWLQDGSFDDDVVRLAESRFPVVVHHACIMVVARTV